MHAQFQQTTRIGRVALAIEGELDLAARDELRAALEVLVAGADHESALVDLSAVTFIDSTALGVLVGAHNKARIRDIALVLVDPSPQCRSVLELTGLTELFEVR